MIRQKIQMPASFAGLLDALTPEQRPGVRAEPAADPVRWPPWLAASWERPREFHLALAAEAERVLSLPAKSRLNAGIDWYSDAVVRHLPHHAQRTVLRFFDPAAGAWRALTLADLDAQAGRLAAALAAQGTTHGERVALVLPSGPLLCVAFLALLRLGCCAVPIQPYGSTYVRLLIEASKPSQVVSCWPHTTLHGLAMHAPIVITPELLATPSVPPRSATYRPESPVLLLEAPLRAPGPLTEVPAGEAYAAALRDGLLLFELRPGDVLMGPADPRYMPVLLLSVLLCGAGFMELSEQAALRDPQGVLKEPARTVLLDRASRDALALRAESGVADPRGLRWGRWFRDPQEPPDAAAWERAGRILPLLKLPHGNLIWDSAAAGTVLFSPPRIGPQHAQVAPAPGCRHLFAALHGEWPAAAASGRFLLLGEDGKPTGAPGEALLLRTESGYLYAGTRLPRRAGCSYPAAAVVALLGSSPQLAGLAGASIVELAGGGPQAQALFVLILFCGALAEESLASDRITALIESELGPSARPDRIEVFPLIPRRERGTPEGVIDQAWVCSQYLAGELHRKSRTAVFRALTRARAALLQEKKT